MPSTLEYKPDFIIIGAMKSATSAIYEYLMTHPLVAKRMPKELHFFTLNYDKGFDWYSQQFKPKQHHLSTTKLLIGEASPSYFPSDIAPNRIAQLLPEVKLILSLRNPSDRAISHYYHQFNRVKDETRFIEEVFSVQEIASLQERPYTKTSSYIQLGKYLPQIQRWLNVFPREQILILNYHDLEINPQAFINCIFNFLGLPIYSIKSMDKIYANQYPNVSREIKQRLDNYFYPYNQKLNSALGINFNSTPAIL